MEAAFKDFEEQVYAPGPAYFQYFEGGFVCMDNFDFLGNELDNNSNKIDRNDNVSGGTPPAEEIAKESTDKKGMDKEIGSFSTIDGQYGIGSDTQSNAGSGIDYNAASNAQYNSGSGTNYNADGNAQINADSKMNYNSGSDAKEKPTSSYQSNPQNYFYSSNYSSGSNASGAQYTNPGSRYQGNASGDFDNTNKTPYYYTENYKKKKKKGIGLVHITAVALISSILGGAVVGSFLLFVAPTIPAFSKYLPTQTAASSNTTTKVEYKIAEVNSQVTAIAEKASPSIVGIRVTAFRQNFLFGSMQPSEGSGIIIREDGYILTNNHVIEDAVNTETGKISDAAKIEVILPNQQDKPYTAQIVGRDARTDMAVIKIDATGLPVAELGDSDKVKVGEMAVAIGNPGGLEFMGSVTVGVISGINRTVQIDEKKQLKVIQTDASINPGNSGGALLNSQGQVIGINTLKAQTQLGYEGIGFAVPINEAKAIADSLIASGYVKGRPKLGVTIDLTYTEDIANKNNMPVGLLVSAVEPFSAAFKAGIQKNDIITKFDGKPVKTFDELEEIKNSHKPGDVVSIEVYRYQEDKTLKLEITIGEDKSGN